MRSKWSGSQTQSWARPCVHLFPPCFLPQQPPVSGGIHRHHHLWVGPPAPGLDEASSSFHLSGCGSIQGQWCGRRASQDVGNVHCWWEGRSATLGLRRGHPQVMLVLSRGRSGARGARNGIIKSAQLCLRSPSVWTVLLHEPINPLSCSPRVQLGFCSLRATGLRAWLQVLSVSVADGGGGRASAPFELGGRRRCLSLEQRPRPACTSVGGEI